MCTKYDIVVKLDRFLRDSNSRSSVYETDALPLGHDLVNFVGECLQVFEVAREHHRGDASSFWTHGLLVG